MKFTKFSLTFTGDNIHDDYAHHNYDLEYNDKTIKGYMNGYFPGIEVKNDILFIETEAHSDTFMTIKISKDNVIFKYLDNDKNEKYSFKLCAGDDIALIKYLLCELRDDDKNIPYPYNFIDNGLEYIIEECPEIEIFGDHDFVYNGEHSKKVGCHKKITTDIDLVDHKYLLKHIGKDDYLMGFYFTQYPNEFNIFHYYKTMDQHHYFNNLKKIDNKLIDVKFIYQ